VESRVILLLTKLTVGEQEPAVPEWVESYKGNALGPGVDD